MQSAGLCRFIASIPPSRTRRFRAFDIDLDERQGERLARHEPIDGHPFDLEALVGKSVPRGVERIPLQTKASGRVDRDRLNDAYARSLGRETSSQCLGIVGIRLDGQDFARGPNALRKNARMDADVRADINDERTRFGVPGEARDRGTFQGELVALVRAVVGELPEPRGKEPGFRDGSVPCSEEPVHDPH